MPNDMGHLIPIPVQQKSSPWTRKSADTIKFSFTPTCKLWGLSTSTAPSKTPISSVSKFPSYFQAHTDVAPPSIMITHVLHDIISFAAHCPGLSEYKVPLQPVWDHHALFQTLSLLGQTDGSAQMWTASLQASWKAKGNRTTSQPNDSLLLSSLSHILSCIKPLPFSSAENQVLR